MDNFSYRTIEEIREKIRRKEISPLEILDAHLRRIDIAQPRLNPFAHVDVENATRQAREAEAAVMRGEHLGPLHGVPVTVKSCMDVTAWPCAAGSVLRKEYRPCQDAPLVARLKSAGAVLLGNTNTPENLMAYETNNLLTGRTSNPWDLSRTSGGSSGGEAAAIASGCSVGGVGSDGGGSVRVPAHFCGICALKPTPGRVPSTGHFPPSSGAFPWLGVVGPMARTIADVRTIFEAICGSDSGDSLSAPKSAKRPAESKLQATRIGILDSPALGTATPETIAAVDRAASYLAAKNFQVEHRHLDGLEQALELWWFFFGTVVGHLFRRNISKAEEKHLSPMFCEYLQEATPQTPLTLDNFIFTCSERDLLRARLIDRMSATPILLSPVCLAPAFPHGHGTWKPGTGYRDTMRHAQWINLAGFPAATVPVALTADGLPIGVQVIGRPYEDELVLAVAEAIEESRGAWQPPPTV